jgi:glycosyltransferase involved in cell wall biosynthesis
MEQLERRRLKLLNGSTTKENGLIIPVVCCDWDGVPDEIRSRRHCYGFEPILMKGKKISSDAKARMSIAEIARSGSCSGPDNGRLSMKKTITNPPSRRINRAETSIVAFGMDDWGGTPQTRQHILTGLAARGWPITYTNGPHFVWGVRQPKWTHASWRSESGKSDGVRLNWPGRWLLRWPRFGAWDRYVQRRYVRTLTGQAGWEQARHRIAYVFHPSLFEYAAELGECLVVYHADDSFSKMPGWTKDFEIAEYNIVDRAALLIATSPGVQRNLPGDGSSRARILQNGADSDFFASGPNCETPADLVSIPRPRIGFFGTISPKVDLRLVNSLAELESRWHWVFVGKFIEKAILADTASRDAWQCLRRRPNVHFLGPRHYRDLPRYQAHMDVNTLCYRTDPGGWWTDLSPLKLHEYLAVGLPVVAAALEVLNPLRHVVAIVNSRDEWINALTHAIDGRGVGTSEQRQEVAFANRWEEIVDQLDSWLAALL